MSGKTFIMWLGLATLFIFLILLSMEGWYWALD